MLSIDCIIRGDAAGIPLSAISVVSPRLSDEVMNCEHWAIILLFHEPRVPNTLAACEHTSRRRIIKSNLLIPSWHFRSGWTYTDFLRFGMLAGSVPNVSSTRAHCCRQDPPGNSLHSPHGMAQGGAFAHGIILIPVLTQHPDSHATKPRSCFAYLMLL